MIYAVIIYFLIGIVCGFLYKNEYQKFDYDNTPCNLYLTIFIGIVLLWPVAVIEYIITDYFGLF